MNPGWYLQTFVMLADICNRAFWHFLPKSHCSTYVTIRHHKSYGSIVFDKSQHGEKVSDTK